MRRAGRSLVVFLCALSAITAARESAARSLPATDLRILNIDLAHANLTLVAADLPEFSHPDVQLHELRGDR